MPDTLSRVLSVIAVTVSAASAGLVGRREWLDRSDLQARLILFGDDDQLYEYAIEIVNLGRRPMGLAGIWTKYPDGDDGVHGVDAPMIPPDGGNFRTRTYALDWLRHHETGDLPVEVKIEDRRGKRYPIKGVERLLGTL